MRSAPFPWPVVPAYAVLVAAPWINRWINRPPRPSRPPCAVCGAPWVPAHECGRVQATIVRRGSGRELERRDGQ